MLFSVSANAISDGKIQFGDFAAWLMAILGNPPSGVLNLGNTTVPHLNATYLCNATACWLNSPNISGGGGGGYTDLTEFVDQTAWRVFYSNADGDVTELVLGDEYTVLRGNGASASPAFGYCPVATNFYGSMTPRNAGVGFAINGAMYNTGGLTVSGSGVEGVDEYYYPDGLYADKPSWKQFGSDWAVWWSVEAGQWRLSSVKGTLGTNYWATSGNTPHDSWIPQGAGNTFSIPLDVWLMDSDSLKAGYLYADNLAEKTAGNGILLNNNLDTNGYDIIFDSGSEITDGTQTSIDPYARTLNDGTSGYKSIDWSNRIIYDASENGYIDYTGSTYTLDINTGNLNVAGDYYANGVQGITGAFDTGMNSIIDFQGGIAYFISTAFDEKLMKNITYLGKDCGMQLCPISFMWNAEGLAQFSNATKHAGKIYGYYKAQDVQKFYPMCSVNDTKEAQYKTETTYKEVAHKNAYEIIQTPASSKTEYFWNASGVFARNITTEAKNVTKLKANITFNSATGKFMQATKTQVVVRNATTYLTYNRNCLNTMLALDMTAKIDALNAGGKT